MNLKIIPTDKTVKFTDIPIGQPFYAYDSCWIRIDRYAAAKLEEGTYHHTSCCTYADPELEIEPADEPQYFEVQAATIVAETNGE